MFDFELINEEQKQAVLTTEGPVLIIAGPGDGGIIVPSQAKTA